MSISFELLEEYTGTRVHEMPDPENEGQTISHESSCNDIQVRFTCSDTGVVHERTVNVVKVGGVYDHEATLVRIGEVANGIDAKIHAGAIQVPAE